MPLFNHFGFDDPLVGQVVNRQNSGAFPGPVAPVPVPSGENSNQRGGPVVNMQDVRFPACFGSKLKGSQCQKGERAYCFGIQAGRVNGRVAEKFLLFQEVDVNAGKNSAPEASLDGPRAQRNSKVLVFQSRGKALT